MKNKIFNEFWILGGDGAWWVMGGWVGVGVNRALAVYVG